MCWSACHHCSTQANKLIHAKLGKVNTNVLEASHNVFIRFRSKDWNITRLHYEVSTNLGLIQSCMTQIFKKWGPDYHWVVDVLTRMGLPVLSGVPAILKMLNNKRHKILENQKTKLGRLKRKRYLKLRKVYDRKKREAWTKTAGKGYDYHGADDETPKRPKGKSRLGGEMRPPKKVRKSCDSFAGDNIACNKVGDESETLVSEYYMYSTDSDSERTPRGPKGKSRLGGERRPWKNVMTVLQVTT